MAITFVSFTTHYPIVITLTSMAIVSFAPHDPIIITLTSMAFVSFVTHYPIMITLTPRYAVLPPHNYITITLPLPPGAISLIPSSVMITPLPLVIVKRQLINLLNQRIHLERLADQIIHARITHAIPLGLPHIRTYAQGLAVPGLTVILQLPYLRRGLVAVFNRHLLVHQYAVEVIPVVLVAGCGLAALFDGVDGFLAVVGDEDLEAPGLQLAAQDFLVDEVVLDEQERALVF